MIYRIDCHVHTRTLSEMKYPQKRSRIIEALKKHKLKFLGYIFRRDALGIKNPKVDIELMDALYVSDAVHTAEEAMKKAFSNGMNVFTVTNHNEINTVVKLAQDNPGKVLIGEELTAIVDEHRGFHLLVFYLNYRKELHYSKSDIARIKKIHAKAQSLRYRYVELLQYLKGQPVHLVLSHPFAKPVTLDVAFMKDGEWDKEFISTLLKYVSCIERRNSSYLKLDNELAEKLADKYSLGFTAGSDSHEAVECSWINHAPGTCYVEGRAKDLKHFFQLSNEGKLKVHGQVHDVRTIKRLILRKYQMFWTNITNRSDRLFKPIIDIGFRIGVFVFYRNLMHSSEKMKKSFRRLF